MGRTLKIALVTAPAGASAVNGPVLDLTWDLRGEVGRTRILLWDLAASAGSVLPTIDLPTTVALDPHITSVALAPHATSVVVEPRRTTVIVDG